MANWPEKTDTCTGTCTKFGAPDLRRFSRLFNNQNVNNACFCNSTVCIQECNVFEFQSDACGNIALRFQEPNAGCNYLTFRTTALAGDRTAIFPAIGATDTIVFNDATATLKNKTLDINPAVACNNLLVDACGSAGDMLQYNATCSRYEPRAIRETFMIRFGDNCTAVGTGNGQYEFQMPYCFTLTEVYATVKTASTCGTPTIQIQQNALDILSTEITIDANEKTSRTAAVAPVISDNTIDINGVMTFDVDVAGTGTAGLVVYLIGYQRF